ncbi:MAG: hypothetical protein K0Q90_3177 [Paenibacillaceae bacterium]|jgi:hypothetical protein|nr:hypothetical protein [Paenibacillaceae bacterium]
MIGKTTVPGQEQNIFLAQMECFTSCVLTYLNRNGCDPRLLLLDYWNFNYEKKTILSSKNAHDLPLGYLYGVEVSFVKGTVEKLEELVKKGDSAINLCSASKLDYFPRRFLDMESSGFWHAILITGMEEETGSYVVSDPVVNVVTRLTPGELTAASVAKIKQDELLMFALSQVREGFQAPDIKTVLRYCSKRNAQHYRGGAKDFLPGGPGSAGGGDADKWEIWRERFRKKSTSGLAAWQQFEHDLTDSAQWPDGRRSAWIKLNTMMMTSVAQLRSKIWGIYKDLADKGEAWEQEGQEQIDAIIKLWNIMQLLLQKYDIRSKRGDGRAIEAATAHIGRIRDAELRFLDWLQESLGEGAHPVAIG